MKRWWIIPVLVAGCTAVSPDGVTDANRVIAAAVSGSDIWLGRLRRGDEWSVSGMINITTRPGYDSQPAFTASGNGVFYSSIRDGAQADIYLYEHQIGLAQRYTATPQSEFSPTPLPWARGISIVRVEPDGTQGLWHYADNQPERLLAHVDDVGYFAWLDRQTVALFLVGDPPRLGVVRIPDGEVRVIAVNPGRSLRRVPGTDMLSFVDKGQEQWWITGYDPVSGEITRIAPVLADGEDFAWTPQRDLLMASQRRIYVWRDRWELVADLGDRLSGNITRMDVDRSGRRIALVVSEGL